MAGYWTEPYRNANTLANHIMQRIMSTEDDKAAALLMREWRETEQMKREWRGVPRLAAHTMREVADARLARARQLPTNAHEVTELDDDKESSGQTVPAPPTPETPSASSVVNDK